MSHFEANQPLKPIKKKGKLRIRFLKEKAIHMFLKE
jgi:hypothetical protein